MRNFGGQNGFLLNMLYLDHGLVPPEIYFAIDDKEALKRSLDTLSPDERRASCRKFRKQLRKATGRENIPSGFISRQNKVMMMFIKMIKKRDGRPS
jgi:hypothetical protein